MTIKRITTKQYRKRADDFMHELVKFRAGYVSEYSGKMGYDRVECPAGHVLQCHHLLGKANWATRYSFENCVAITRWEHNNIAHNAAMAPGFLAWAEAQRDLDSVRILSKSTSHPVEFYYLALAEEYRKAWESGGIRKKIAFL